MLNPLEVSKSTIIVILLGHPAFNTTYHPWTVSFGTRLSLAPKTEVLLRSFSAKMARARVCRANNRP